jgi:hypothetical protein
MKPLCAVVACGIILTLAGCGTPKRATAVTTTTRKPVTTIPVTPTLPKTVPNEPNLRRYVVLEQCAAIPGGWKADGTAVDPGASPARYRITVYFTDSQATVVGFAQTTVKVAPGKKARWLAEDTFAAPKKTLCVLSGVG